MTRTLAKLALIAASALALAACETNPTKTDAAAQAAPPPVATAAQQPKSLVEMEFELRKAEIALQTTQTMAMIKFAAESNSPFAMGMVAGLYGGKAQAAAPASGGASFVQTIMQDRRHQSEIELRKAELEERGSLWNKGLQVFDRVFDYRKFSKGLGLQRHSMDIAADQYKFTVDALGGAQRDAYSFGTTVLDRGPLILQVPEGSSASVIRLAD